MTIYVLSPLNKKSAIDTEILEKKINGKMVRIEHEIGWRWASVSFESENDDFSFIDLNNKNTFRPYEVLEVLDATSDDVCWEEWRFPEYFSLEETERLQKLQANEGIGGLEEDGWIFIETETIYTGPLEVRDENGVVLAQGEEPARNEIRVFKVDVFSDSEKTGWLSIDINPIHLGLYEVTSLWPFPEILEWDGADWIDAFGDIRNKSDISQWRGLRKKLP